MGTAIFDICDTLYAANTTVEFLRFVGERGHPRLLRTVERWTSRRSALFFIGAIAHRLFGTDLARRRIIAGLAGMSVEAVDSEAEQFVRLRLAPLCNDAVRARLAAHQASGDKVVLISSTIAPVARAIGEVLGVSAIGSDLKAVDGHYTGRIADDLTGRKLEVAARHVPADRPISVYTDNRSDADLLHWADRGIVVLPKGRQDERWAGEGYDYLTL